MKKVFAPLLLAALPTSTMALESVTVGAKGQQASIDVLNSKIDTVSAVVANIVNCNEQGKVYGPSHAGADANGCYSNSNAIPSGTIAAFASTACPTGWSEYTAARGKFLRGIDNGAGYDTGGTRAPGNYQADMLASHSHSFGYYAAAWQNVAASYSGWGGYPGMVYSTTAAAGGAETRPRNIAVLFCRSD